MGASRVIRSVLLLALALAGPSAAADGTPLSVDELAEHMLGSASQPLRFNWRRMTAAPGVTGSSLVELNNFNSNRLGLMVRRPVFGLLGEVALSRVWTASTPSSKLLSLTPYRQAGRPSRWELDLNVHFPLAEGVVTAWPAFLPAAQLVFSASGGVRYLFYPRSVRGMSILDASTALVSPYLTDDELANLETVRNAGMQIDRARYALLVGFSTDVYFHQGLFFSPRVLLDIPLLSGADGDGVGFWWELSFAVGWAL